MDEAQVCCLWFDSKLAPDCDFSCQSIATSQATFKDFMKWLEFSFDKCVMPKLSTLRKNTVSFVLRFHEPETMVLWQHPQGARWRASCSFSKMPDWGSPCVPFWVFTSILPFFEFFSSWCSCLMCSGTDFRSREARSAFSMSVLRQKFLMSQQIMRFLVDNTWLMSVFNKSASAVG